MEDEYSVLRSLRIDSSCLSKLARFYFKSSPITDISDQCETIHDVDLIGFAVRAGAEIVRTGSPVTGKLEGLSGCT